MSTTMKTALFLALASSFTAAATESCEKRFGATLKHLVPKDKIVKCELAANVLPAKFGGQEQLVVLHDSEVDGVSISIFGSFKRGEKYTFSPLPLFTFPGLGEVPESFAVDGQGETTFMVKDLGGNAFSEIAILGSGEPNANLAIKTYDEKKKRFQDLVFSLPGVADKEWPIVVGPGEKLTVPSSLSAKFTVKGEKETRVYTFSKLVN